MLYHILLKITYIYENRKIKLAVVGIGVMGVKHIDAINKTSNAKLTAVVDFKKIQ